MTPDVRAWISSAEVDYRLVARASAPPAIPEGVCFHAQQCLEKYLKALLEDAQRPIPRSHDLGTLCTLVADLFPAITAFEADLRAMGPYAVGIRYPSGEGPWGVLEEEADEARATMDAVRALVRERFGLTSA